MTGWRGSVYSPPVNDPEPTTQPELSPLLVTSLGSGSSGNALLVRTTDAVVLVDCGVGVRRITRALGANNTVTPRIDAVLISHEHIDHVRELPRFVATDTPVLSTKGTAFAARIPTRSWEEMRPSLPTSIAGVEVVAIPVSHDASEPCGFLIRSASGSITVLTDLGCASPVAAEAIAESHLIVLEANHDEALLRRGPYPVHLQRRILSDSGHLSNDACAALLASALRGSTRLPTVWLAHLSETNNRPHLATQAVRRRLAQAGLRLDVQALPRREISATWSPNSARSGVAQLTLGFPPL
jgi:phosphoribosyl 1,2-cyclic phosphodiesterase